MNFLILLFGLLIGGFSILCSVKNYDWFFRARRARVIDNLMGRNGARIFYTVLGVIFIIAGIVVCCSV